MDFFSDRELGKSAGISEEISNELFNGILALYERYQNNLAKQFPAHCPDGGAVVGLDRSAFSDAAKALIPNMEFIRCISAFDECPDKYAILDSIEFVYENLWDYKVGQYHSYFRHDHLDLLNTRECRKTFKDEINQMLERNGVVFYLDTDGKIKRQLPAEMDSLIQKLKIHTADQRLNELIQQATEDIRKPELKDRTYALEKLWDAFERMKTFYSSDKKTSSTQVFQKAASTTPQFESVLTDEAHYLTKIGNEYQIRHFETNKIQIMDPKHIDYLYYRMLSLISLCIEQV
ncbi:MAG: hypothetical protein U0O02_04250 [Eubacteriales bacterium]